MNMKATDKYIAAAIISTAEGAWPLNICYMAMYSYCVFLFASI